MMLREPLKIELNIPMTISREFPPTHCRPAANQICQCTSSTLAFEQQYAQFNKFPMQSANAVLLYCKTKISQPLQHLRNT